MKKAIALLVAITTVLSLGVLAYADGGYVVIPENNNMTVDTTPYVAPGGAVNTAPNAGTPIAGDTATDNSTLVLPETAGDTGVAGGGNAAGGVAGNAAGLAGDNGIGTSPFSLEWETGVSGGVSTDYLTIGKDEIFLVWAEGDSKGEVVVPDSILTPGEEYTFHIYKAVTAVAATDTITTSSAFLSASGGIPVTKADLADGKLRNRTKGASGLVNVTIDTRGSGSGTRYELDVDVREQFTTKLSDLEFTLSVTGGTGSDLVSSTSVFQVGFAAMDDDDIDAYSEGDIITIYNDTPVVTSKQFSRLAKAYNYKAITFENEDGTWNYTARVSGNSDINFYNTERVVEDLIMKLPEQDFKFVNFHSGGKFATNGEMRIDVSDIYPDYGTMHTYLYRNGVLTPITTSYESTNNELVFRTNYLGTFVITNAEITDLNILAPEENTDIETPVEEPELPPIEEGTHPTNPSTGLDATMNLLMTLGLAAIGGSGIIRKKK